MRLLIACLSVLPLLAQEATKPADPKPEDQKKEEKAAPAKEETPPPTASDRELTGSVDVGYRWRTDVSGNYNAYRSVVNLGEGPKVFGFDLTLLSPTRKFFDKINLIGSGWGGDPYSTVRLNAFKERTYDLRADYRNIAYYDFLPSFSDPTAGTGVYLNERAYDLRRRMFDGEIRFRPGTHIIPYIAYSRDWGVGSGITTFVATSNEYPVWNSLDDKTDRYRAGVNFEFNHVHLTVEQGGTRFRDDQRVAFAGAQNRGNRTTPIFGQNLFLNSLNQQYNVTGNSVFTKILGTISIGSRVDLAGQVLYSRPETKVFYEQTNTGNFIDLSAIQFFATQQDFLSANANQPHTSLNFSATVRPARRLRVLASWMSDHYTTASSAILSDVTTVTPAALQTLATDRLEVNYHRQQTEADLDVTRWLTLRGGYRAVWGDSSVRAPQVIGLQYEFGNLNQKVGLAGAQFRFGQKIWINTDTEVGSSDHTYFRISLRDYQKVTTRARYQAFTSLGFTANISALHNENPTPGINLDFDSRTESVGFFWNPKQSKRFSLLGDYTRSSLRSNIAFITPQDGTPDTSRYVDNAHTATALLDLAPFTGKHAPRLSLGGSYFQSSGSRPSGYYQPIVKFQCPVRERVQLFSEWRWYDLSETFYNFEGFRTHLFIAGVRLSR